MIRVSKHTLKFSNKEKLEKLNLFFQLFKDSALIYKDQIFLNLNCSNSSFKILSISITFNSLT